MLRAACVKAAALQNVFVVALLQREVRGAALHDRTVKNYGPKAGRKSNLAFIIGTLKEPWKLDSNTVKKHEMNSSAAKTDKEQEAAAIGAMDLALALSKQPYLPHLFPIKLIKVTFF